MYRVSLLSLLHVLCCLLQFSSASPRYFPYSRCTSSVADFLTTSVRHDISRIRCSGSRFARPSILSIRFRLIDVHSMKLITANIPYKELFITDVKYTWGWSVHYHIHSLLLVKSLLKMSFALSFHVHSRSSLSCTRERHDRIQGERRLRKASLVRGSLQFLLHFFFPRNAASSLLLSLIINRSTISVSPSILVSLGLLFPRVLSLSHGPRCRAESWRMAARINSPGAIRTPPRSYLINVIRGLMDDSRREAAASCFRRAQAPDARVVGVLARGYEMLM